MDNLLYDEKEQGMVAIIKQNNQLAFAIIYDKYASLLYGVVKRMVINDPISEIIFQKVFAEVWRKREGYDISKERLFTWMHRIARAVTIDFIRTGKVVCESEMEALHNSVYGEAIESFLLKKNKTNVAAEAITKTGKEALSLLYFKGGTIPEAATQLGIPLNELVEELKKVIKSLNESVAI